MSRMEQVPQDWLDQQLLDASAREAFLTEICRLRIAGDIDPVSVIEAVRKVIAAGEREDELRK